MERFPGGERLTTSRTKMPQAIDFKFGTHISNRVLKKSSIGTWSGDGGGGGQHKNHEINKPNFLNY